MSAFDALERRVIALSLGGAQDAPEANVVVGLFTSSPGEAHDGRYGLNGEPAKAAAVGTGYTRARARFGAATDPGTGGWRVTNTEPVAITGLPPGTYTHFAVFGSGSGV